MKQITISFIAILAFFVGIMPVWALSNPSSVTLGEVNVYRSVVEEDDLLVIARYNIDYSTLPSQGSNDTWLFRVMEPGGDPQLGVNTPYPYNDLGYNQGLGSVYLTAAQWATYTGGGGAWADALVVRLEGNPAFYTNPLVASYTLTAADYSTPADGGGIPPCDTDPDCQDTNRTQLAARILAIASELQGYWGGSSLVESSALGSRLTSTGELYFGLAIPGLVVMAPGAYAVISTDPDVAARTYTNTGQTNAENRYSTETWLAGFDTLNSDWGLPSKTVQTIITLFLMAFALISSQIALGRIEPGFGIAFMALPIFWYMGFVPFQMAAIMLFIMGAIAFTIIARMIFRGVA